MIMDGWMYFWHGFQLTGWEFCGFALAVGFWSFVSGLLGELTKSALRAGRNDAR